VFYSDQVPDNRQVDSALASTLGPTARIGFVPSSADPQSDWFHKRCAYYRDSGLNLACAYDPVHGDLPSLERLLRCDAIHLSGGDTAQFLRLLIAADMLNPLREFAQRGGY
jgi:dipeptidase E